MTIFNLLNAIQPDKPLFIILVSLAAALLAVIVVVVACSVHARKKRKQKAATQIPTDEAKPENQLSSNTQNADDGISNKEVNLDQTDDEDSISDDELAELAAAEENGAEDVDEAISVALAKDGGNGGQIVYRSIRYNRSFWARLTQAGDDVKARYSELKNELLSYDKVKSALSWKRERFSLGRNTFACFVMRGKKLCLRFATDPKRFDGTKYKVIDLSVRSPKSKQPCMYRITSERKVRYAKEIIELLTSELSLEKVAGFVGQNYTMPYRETDALIQDGLIKVKVIEGIDGADTAYGADNVERIREIVKQAESLPKRDFTILKQVEATEVNVMSDAEAAKLIERKVVKQDKSAKGKKGIINIDVLSQKFQAGDRITVEALREKRIIPGNVNCIKVLANGVLDKPLIVEADDFSLAAVKMIALTGGRVIRTSDK